MDNLSYLLELKNICKYFGKIHALKNTNLNVKKGEVMGLVGDNGAGKSTLMKVISGAYTPDEDEIYLNGEKVVFKHPLEAQKKVLE